MSAYTDMLAADGAGVAYMFDMPGPGTVAWTDMNGANPLTVLAGTAARRSITSPAGMNTLVADFSGFRANRATQATLNFATAAGSVEWWARRPSPDTSRPRQNFIKVGTHGYSLREWEYLVPPSPNPGIATLYITTSGGAAQINSAGDAQKSGVWQHWCGTWDGTTARFYVDGVEHGNAPATGTYTNSTGALFIGGSAANDEVDGSITGFAVYQRALTAAEVRKHYDVGMGRHRIRASGSFASKGHFTKVGGSFVEAPRKVKVGGVFV